MTPVQKKCLSLSKSAFNLVVSKLAIEDAEIIRGYIFDHNEWGLGMESLVYTLIEDSIAVTPAQNKAIQIEMDSMKLERSQHLIKVAEE